jgi:hypothetical protein
MAIEGRVTFIAPVYVYGCTGSIVKVVGQVSKESNLWSPERQPLLDALLASPDVESVLRLSIVEGTGGSPRIVAATIAIVESLPTYVVSHALLDAKRRVEAIVGSEVEIFVEPDLVKDPARTDPPTDVIVIRASD